MGGNLHIQGQFDVHQLLIVLQEMGQVLLSLLQGLPELCQIDLAISGGQFTMLLRSNNCYLQVGILKWERGEEED